jgi:hypothetical protein
MRASSNESQAHVNRRHHLPHSQMVTTSDVYPRSIQFLPSRGADEPSSPTLSFLSSSASTMRLVDIVNEALSIVEDYTDDVNPSEDNHNDRRMPRVSRRYDKRTP